MPQFDIYSYSGQVFFIFVAILAFIILLSPYFLGPSRPEIEKTVVYECGFDAYGSSRVAFDIRFYLVGMLFLIFDLETIIFLPWVLLFPFLGFFVSNLCGVLRVVLTVVQKFRDNEVH